MASTPFKRRVVRLMGHVAPSLLRFLARHNPTDWGRWPTLSALMDDARCRKWLASLENPTGTRRGFRIFTLPGDLTSDWIKLHGEHEVGTERFILDHLRRDSTFLDIGANIGYFSLLAAVTGRSRVVAFEPQRPIADLLVKSAEHNQVSGSLRVECLALSDAPATMRMTSCPGNTGHARLARPSDESAQPYSVAVVTLDEWLKENPVGPISVCKIDTEGSEFKVLQGMAQLLARDGPAVVIEVIDEFLADFDASGSWILAFLGSLGYTDVTGAYSSKGDRNRYLVRTRPVSR